MNHLNRLTRLSRSVAGTVAIVTGAASGMGRATALLLADEGAAVGLVDRNAEGLAEVVDTIRSAGARVHGVCADVARPSARSTQCGNYAKRWARSIP